MRGAIWISRDVRYYQQTVVWLAERKRHDEALALAAECLEAHQGDPVAHAVRSLATS